VSNRRTGAPLRLEDRFRAGGITKTMTAVTVLRLVDQGRLRLDSRLSEFVPGVANGSRITMRQLLRMRAGEWSFTESPLIIRGQWANPAMPWTADRTVRLIRAGEPQYPPGISGKYDNSNYVLPGKIIETVPGRSALVVLQDEVLAPAGLTATTLPRTTGMPGPFRRGYVPMGDGRIGDTTIANPDVPWTAGNAISTLRDLGTWARVLGTGARVSPGSAPSRSAVPA